MFIEKKLQAEFGLRYTDFVILLYLDSHPCVKQDMISKYFALNKATVAKSLYRLEQAEMIAREINRQDRREKSIQLLEAATHCIQRVQEETSAFCEAALGDLPPEEQKAFIDLSEHMAKKIWTMNTSNTYKEECSR